MRENDIILMVSIQSIARDLKGHFNKFMFGSNYKGTLHGVMVVTVPEFSNYIFTNGESTSYAYSAFPFS